MSISSWTLRRTTPLSKSEVRDLTAPPTREILSLGSPTKVKHLPSCKRQSLTKVVGFFLLLHHSPPHVVDIALPSPKTTVVSGDVIDCDPECGL